MDKRELTSFDGLTNFRDMGGLTTLDGKKMKTGMLYRSDELSQLSKRDIEKIHTLGIKLICDVRTPREQRSKRSRMAGRGINIENVSVYDKSQEFTRVGFLKFLIGKAHKTDFEVMMKEIYHHIAFSSCEEIKKVLLLLSEETNLPALIHCTSGKDRTGYLAAVLQLLAGVPYETVVVHYLQSNESGGARMKRIETFVRLMSFFRVSPEQIKPMLEVRRLYLDHVYNGVTERYGDIETYLQTACGIPSSQLNELKTRLVEQP